MAVTTIVMTDLERERDWERRAAGGGSYVDNDGGDYLRFLLGTRVGESKCIPNVNVALVDNSIGPIATGEVCNTFARSSTADHSANQPAT